jgi:hypothetical protein
MAVVLQRAQLGVEPQGWTEWVLIWMNGSCGYCNAAYPSTSKRKLQLASAAHSLTQMASGDEEASIDILDACWDGLLVMVCLLLGN